MNQKDRGLFAKQALDNPVLDEAFADIKARIFSLWEISHSDKWKDREVLYCQLQALNDFRGQLENYLHTAALETTAEKDTWT